MLETFPSAAALADAAAVHAVAGLAGGLAARGRASLVATGGRAPGPVYDRLAQSTLDWSRITVTLSDERCVAADAPESNEGLVRARLLLGPAAQAAFIPLFGAGDPEPRLRSELPFDVVMLGMGEDGHVASLLPGMPGLAAAMDPEGAALVQAVPAGWGSPPLARITLTLAALLAARTILILIAGDAKRRAVEAALAGADLPVRALLVQGRAPVRVLWAPTHDDGR